MEQHSRYELEANQLIKQLAELAEGVRRDATWLLDCAHDFIRAVGRLHSRTWSEAEICRLQVLEQTYRGSTQSDLQRAVQELNTYIADVEAI